MDLGVADGKANGPINACHSPAGRQEVLAKAPLGGLATSQVQALDHPVELP